MNCGSSSLKFQLINSETEAVAAKGLCERIGIDGRLVYQPAGGEKEVTEKAMPTHTEAIKMVLDALVNPSTGVLKNLDEVEAIGHRVLHGGAKISDSCIINDEVISVIEECCDLGPLHNPANLMGIRACMDLMPGKPNVAVFAATLLSIRQCRKKHICMQSHTNTMINTKFVNMVSTELLTICIQKETIKFLGLDPENSKVIVAHLGNGSSISAVVNGKCVDTSMGLTPLEGLVMGTRSGDLDRSS